MRRLRIKNVVYGIVVPTIFFALGWYFDLLKDNIDTQRHETLMNQLSVGFGTVNKAFTKNMFESVMNVFCDEIHGPIEVEYNMGYSFYNTFDNNSNSDLYVISWDVAYINPEYLDAGDAFNWSDELVSEDYIIRSGESLEYVRTGKVHWRIAEMSKYDDWEFAIIYTYTFGPVNSQNEKNKYGENTSCVLYDVVPS